MTVGGIAGEVGTVAQEVGIEGIWAAAAGRGAGIAAAAAVRCCCRRGSAVRIYKGI